MNTETQNLIAKSVNRLVAMMELGFPDVLIDKELQHLAKLWNITGEVGEC